MEIDLKKYLTNKEIEVNNEDFNLDKLSKDLLKGYVAKTELDNARKGMVEKTDFDKLQSDYTNLELTNQQLTKTLNDTNDRYSKVSLENVMVRKGFKEEDFEEVSKLRRNLYGEVKNDTEAINTIAEKYKATFFKEEGAKYTQAPNEAGIKGTQAGISNQEPIKITRNTSVKSLMSFNK